MQVEIRRGSAAAQRAAGGEYQRHLLAEQRGPQLEPIHPQPLHHHGDRRMEQRGWIHAAAAAPLRWALDADLAGADIVQAQARGEQIGGRDGEHRIRDGDTRALRIGELDLRDTHVEGDEAADAGDGHPLGRARQPAADALGEPGLARSGLQQPEGERQHQQQPENGAARQLQRSAQCAHPKTPVQYATPMVSVMR